MRERRCPIIYSPLLHYIDHENEGLKMSQKKSDQLGMTYGKANNILRKSILFHLAGRCGMTQCFQCGKEIEHVDDFSIEHKETWLDSVDPVGLYFDLDNIAFSHADCNYRAARRDMPKRRSAEKLKKTVAKSGYVGVYHHPDKKKPWQARPYLNDTMYSKGYYETPEEAARVVDASLIECYGESVVTNRSIGFL